MLGQEHEAVVQGYRKYIIKPLWLYVYGVRVRVYRSKGVRIVSVCICIAFVKENANYIVV